MRDQNTTVLINSKIQSHTILILINDKNLKKLKKSNYAAYK